MSITTALSTARKGTVFLSIVCFAISYIALADLAHIAGLGPEAYLWPVMVDGTIIIGTVAVLARPDRHSWSLLTAGAIVSIGGNSAHAWITQGTWIAVAVAVYSPGVPAVGHQSDDAPRSARRYIRNRNHDVTARSRGSAGYIPKRTVHGRETCPCARAHHRGAHHVDAGDRPTSRNRRQERPPMERFNTNRTQESGRSKHMKRTLIAVAAGTLLLTGCSSNETPATQEQSTQTPDETTAAEREFPIIGEEARSQGIAITVHGLAEQPTITVNDSGYTGESAEFTERVPRAGGKFVVVDTTVLNDGLTPIDITCAGPIRNTLTTEGQRQYSTVDEQYNIQGNPECNDMLQPGFDAPMKFVYEVPAAAVPVAFGFSDAANVGDKPTYIELISE